MEEEVRKKTSVAKNARKILRFLSKNRKKISPLLILPHNYPDPDAIASAFALKYIVEEAYGMSAKIGFGGVIGRMENRAMVKTLKIPLRKVKSSEVKKSKNVALVDTQPAFDNNPFFRSRNATIIIDQHPSVKKPSGECVVIDTECGATSVILAECLLLTKLRVPVNLATALSYGILSDTQNFYRSHSVEIMQIYLDILLHSDLKALAQIQNPCRSRRFFKTLGKSIQNASEHRKVLVSHLGAVDNPDLVSQIADFFLNYEKTLWAFCTGRYKGKMYVSLRGSKSNLVAGDVLRDVVPKKSQAGGHGLIAGGSFRVGKDATPALWAQTEEQLVQKLLKRLRVRYKKDQNFPFRDRVLKGSDKA